MTTPAAELPLAAGFPEATRAAWQELVKGVLVKSGAVAADASPEAVEAALAVETYDGVRISALYTVADLAPTPDAAPTSAAAPAPAAARTSAAAAGLPGLAPFVRGSRPQGANLDGWDVRARHTNPDAKLTGEAVLADLENGVSSLWLAVGDGGLPVASLPVALDAVLLDLAPIVLDAGAQTPAAAEALFGLATERAVPASELSGNLGSDPIGLAARTGAAPEFADTLGLAARCAAGFPRLRAMTVDALPYHSAGASDAEELGVSLAVGVAYLRALTGSGLSLPAALGQLDFRYAVTADQFASIAKLRAARRLWARVAQVCGAEPAQRVQRQHAVTSPAMMSRRDPWVNMLRTTLACFGAGVGGADAVTVLPFDAEIGLPDDFSRRIARNTSTLLQEESSLIRVVDPAGGSWYVESLTDELAKAAWAVFTEVEKAGGGAAALASGRLAARFDATWARRRDAVAHRRDPLTGVSEFPNLTEKLPVRPAAPVRAAGGAGALPVRRYAQDFEALRDAADAHLAETGARPTVFLATVGPLAAYTARASFAANLFQAGGFETVLAGPGNDPEAIAAAFTASGATVACLCSTDKIYAESAAPVASALKAAGARRVWLAGKAGSRAETDAAAGVDGYVFTGCDAVAVLRATQTDSGVSAPLAEVG